MPAEVTDIADIDGIWADELLERLVHQGWQADAEVYEKLSSLRINQGDVEGSIAFADAARWRRAVGNDPREPGAYFELCDALNNCRLHATAFSAFCAGVTVSTIDNKETPATNLALFKYAEQCPREIYRYMVNWLTPIILELVLNLNDRINVEILLRLANQILYNVCDIVDPNGVGQASPPSVTQRMPMHELLRSLDKLLDSLPSQKRTALEKQLLSLFKAAGGLVSEEKIDLPASKAAANRATQRATSAKPPAEETSAKLPEVADVFDILEAEGVPEEGRSAAIISEATKFSPIGQRRAAAEKTTTRPQWKDYKGKIELPDFVTWAYAAEIEAKTLSKAALHADKTLYPDYFTWRRRRHLPPELHWLRDLPTGTQQRDQQLTKAGLNPAPEHIEDFSQAEQEVIRRYESSKKRGYRVRSSRLKSSTKMSMD